MDRSLQLPREAEASKRGCLERGCSSRQQKLWTAMVLAGYLLSPSCILVSQARNIAIRTEPPRPLVGKEVTFFPAGTMENVSRCCWFRSYIRKKNEIVNYQTSPILRINYSHAYTGREQIQLDCSLSITNLKLRDTGFYVILKKRTVQNVYEKGKVLLKMTGKDIIHAKNITLKGKETAGIVVGSLLGFIVLVGMLSHRKLKALSRNGIETYTL